MSETERVRSESDATRRGERARTDQRPTTIGPDIVAEEASGGRKRATLRKCTLKFSLLPPNAMTAIKTQLVVFDFDW